MSHIKAPAFQFYPKDWIADANVCELSLEEEGAYIRLLSYCWLEGSIPADPMRCARIIGKGCSIETATSVQRLFNESSTNIGKLVHKRLEIERDKQQIRREQASEAGRKSGVKRRNPANPAAKPPNDRSDFVERKPNPSSASSSSSPTAVIKTGGEAAIAAPPAVPYEEVRLEFDRAFGLNSRMTDKRKQALKARWNDEWWKANWRAALARGAESAFLRGANLRNWVIDLEFFLRPDSATKILEGKYDNRETYRQLPTNSAAAREQRNADAFAVLEAAIAESEDFTSGGIGYEDGGGGHQTALCHEEYDGPDTLCD